MAAAARARPFRGAIFDVDGVLVDSPHERAWRETLDELMAADWSDIRGSTTYAPGGFTPALYARIVAGKPRRAGALAALRHFRVPRADDLADVYGARKQARIEALIEAGEFRAYPDALRFVDLLEELGIPAGAASSSKNADALLRRVEWGGRTLLDRLAADVSGRDFAHGKPAPDIFTAAAEALGEQPGSCFVVEDAVAGVRAAAASGAAALGVARDGDRARLERAGADLAVASLDEVDPGELAGGRLARRAAHFESAL